MKTLKTAEVFTDSASANMAKKNQEATMPLSSSMQEALHLINEAARNSWCQPCDEIHEVDIHFVKKGFCDLDLVTNKVAEPLFNALVVCIIEGLAAKGLNGTFVEVIKAMRKWQGICLHLPLDKDIKKSLVQGFKACGNYPKAQRMVFRISKNW